MNGPGLDKAVESYVSLSSNRGGLFLRKKGAHMFAKSVYFLQILCIIKLIVQPVPKGMKNDVNPFEPVFCL